MNSLRNKLVITALLLFPAFVSQALASTPEPPAVPADYVVDLAGVIRSDVKAELNARLRELEQKTTAQVVVLTVQSLDGQDIESFSLDLAHTKWKLGQKGKDNGVLLVIAVKDRKYRIEVGYGLESVLPDSLVGTIGRQLLVPAFRKGDYSRGIYSAAMTIAQTIAEHEGVQLAEGHRASGPGRTISMESLTTVQKVLFGFLALAFFALVITHPRQCFLIMLASQMGGGRGGWSGGGGGGFSGGGFGGGGGGGFGGGGSSGGW